MKRLLTDCIPEDALYRLTEEAFEQAPAGEKKAGRTAPRILALAASLAIVVTALRFDLVYAAVRELLYFLPGSGSVAQEEQLEYWLPGREFSAQIKDTRYFVTYLYRRGDTLAIGVKKESGPVRTESRRDGADTSPYNSSISLDDEEKAKLLAGMAGDDYQFFKPAEGPESHFEEAPAKEEPYSHPDFAAPPESRPADPAYDGATLLPAAPEKMSAGLEIAFLDEDGNPIELEHTDCSSSSAYDGRQMEVWEALEIEGFSLERFTLELDGVVRFPVELHRVDLEDYALTKSTVAEDAGYQVSLLPLNEGCTRFALIPVPVGEQAGQAPKGSYWTPLSFGLEVVGEDGKVYEAEAVNSRPGCQEYYLPAMPETRIKTITLTAILESTRYEKPAAAVVLPALEPGEIQEVGQELSLWNLSLTVRAAGLTEDGTLWAEIACKGGEGVRLNQLDLEWPREDHGLSLTHTGLEEGGQIIAAHEMAHRAGKKTRLPVTFVSVIHEGHWTFSDPTRRCAP